MQLVTKPDFERVKDVWRHFWAKDVLKRPPVIAAVTRPGHEPVWPGSRRYWRAVTGRWDEQMALIDRWIENTDFLAEYVPHFAPDFGPDQFAAFLGGTLAFSEDSPETNWLEAWVDDWTNTLPLRLDPQNPTLQRVLDYGRRLAAHGRGRYLVGVCDLHSNMDTLLAIRGGQRLSMDFYDAPEQVERAMADVRRMYRPVYEALYAAGGMTAETGSIGWVPFWSPGRFATIQCDYICMISPELGRRYVIPALDEEASFLDHCVYHLDGPGTLPHLDDILAIERIDCIQWVSGAGQRAMHEWTDVLQRCQAAGKSLDIYSVTPDQVKQLHRELKPNLVSYQVRVQSAAECDELCAWLERNT